MRIVFLPSHQHVGDLAFADSNSNGKDFFAKAKSDKFRFGIKADGLAVDSIDIGDKEVLVFSFAEMVKLMVVAMRYSEALEKYVIIELLKIFG
jgi:hypothetical protein